MQAWLSKILDDEEKNSNGVVNESELKPPESQGFQGKKRQFKP